VASFVAFVAITKAFIFVPITNSHSHPPGACTVACAIDILDIRDPTMHICGIHDRHYITAHYTRLFMRAAVGASWLES